MKVVLLIIIILVSISARANNTNLYNTAKLADDTFAVIDKTLQGPINSSCPSEPKLFQGINIEVSSRRKEKVKLSSGPSVIIEINTLKRPTPKFDTIDGAVKFFVNYVRDSYSINKVEYCTNIIKIGIKYTFKNIIRGTPGSCPEPKNQSMKDVVAGVHTHPGAHTPNHNHYLNTPIQTPSMGDYAVAKYSNVPQYMAAPAGHILKFDKKDVECRGSSFIKRRYEVIQRPYDTSKGKIENLNSWINITNKDDLKTMRKWICEK